MTIDKSVTIIGEIILLLVIFLILSTTIDMLPSQEYHIHKHKIFVSSVRKKHTLKLFVNKIILFSAILSAYYHIIQHCEVIYSITNVILVNISGKVNRSRYTTILQFPLVNLASSQMLLSTLNLYNHVHNNILNFFQALNNVQYLFFSLLNYNNKSIPFQQIQYFSKCDINCHTNYISPNRNSNLGKYKLNSYNFKFYCRRCFNPL